MSGLKITGFNETTVTALQRAQQKMSICLCNIKHISNALLAIQEKLRAGDTPAVLMEGIDFVADEEFLISLEDILLGLFNRKNRAMQSHEWEIPLTPAPKPQEPDDGVSDLYV